LEEPKTEVFCLWDYLSYSMGRDRAWEVGGVGVGLRTRGLRSVGARGIGKEESQES
jgi:hypothetical protein